MELCLNFIKNPNVFTHKETLAGIIGRYTHIKVLNFTIHICM